MKVDQQALKKHHFWILLGVYALFALLLIILVPVLIGGEIEEKEAKYEEAKKGLETASKSPTTQGFLDEQKKIVASLDTRRNTIWREMYQRQLDVIRLPDDTTARAELSKIISKVPFGGEIDDRSRNQYRQEEIYLDAYREMANSIKPTEFAGSWESVLMPVTWRTDRLPTSEEVWLSLEDMSVRREVLGIVANANAEVATFKEVKPRPQDLPTSPLGEQFSKRFRSRQFILDLVITEKERGKYVCSGKIKNISGRRQVIYALNLDLTLTPDRSSTQKAPPVFVQFPLDALSAGQERELEEQPLRVNQRPVELFRVALRHNFKTVPVKQIKQLVLGLNAGHRMADRKLEMTKFSKKITEEAAATTSGPSSGGGGPMGGGGLMGPMGFGASMSGTGGPSGGGAQAADTTINGLMRERYIAVTDQVRRMPVAILLVVDQSNLQDVLAAFSNSQRMRFQITQYHWQRFYGSILNPDDKPDGDGAGGDIGDGRPMGGRDPRGGGPQGPGGFGPAGFGGAGPKAPGGAGPMGPGGFGPAGFGPGGFGPGGFGPGGFGPGGFGSQAVTEQQQLSLVELSIYGVANLYEKPADPEKDASATNPMTTSPSAPAGTTNTSATNPPEPALPATPSQPADNTKPADPAKPEGAAQPMGGTKPAGDNKPAGTDKPAGENKPAGDQPPAGDNKPPAPANNSDKKNDAPAAPPAGDPKKPGT